MEHLIRHLSRIEGTSMSAAKARVEKLDAGIIPLLELAAVAHGELVQAVHQYPVGHTNVVEAAKASADADAALAEALDPAEEPQS